MTYQFQRGETIALALDAIDGDPSTVSAITAQLRRIRATGQVLPTEPVAATFTIATRAATSTLPAGWTLTIAATDSAGLSAGTYQADAKIVIGDGVTVTDPIAILIREPATL